VSDNLLIRHRMTDINNCVTCSPMLVNSVSTTDMGNGVAIQLNQMNPVTMGLIFFC